MQNTMSGTEPMQLPAFVDAAEARFLVYNVTDGVLAWPELMTLASAQRFVQQFPERFTRQGYYRTAFREQIRPDAVRLEIVDAATGLAIGPVSASTPRGDQNE